MKWVPECSEHNEGGWTEGATVFVARLWAEPVNRAGTFEFGGVMKEEAEDVGYMVRTEDVGKGPYIGKIL